MKFLAFALVALFALQGIASANEIDNGKLSLADQKAVSDIIDKVKELVKQALAAVKEAVENIKELLGKVVDQITEKVSEAIGQLKEIIKDIINKASEEGKNVVECAAASEDAVNQLAQDALAEGTVCANNAINNALGILQTLQDNVEEINKQILDLAAKLLNCNWQPACIIEVAKEIAAFVVKVTPEILKDIKDIAETVIQVQNETAKCILDLGVKVAKDSVKIVEDVKTCIASK